VSHIAYSAAGKNNSMNTSIQKIKFKITEVKKQLETVNINELLQNRQHAQTPRLIWAKFGMRQ